MKKVYSVDGFNFDMDAEEVREHIEMNADDSIYDEMLDDCYPVIKIGNIEFSPSRVLSECDPIAYRCGYNDWTNSELCDVDFNDMEDGETVWVCGIEVNCKEVPDEEDEEETEIEVPNIPTNYGMSEDPQTWDTGCK